MQCILKVLVEFEDLLGLKANPSKSSVFKAGVPPLEKQALLHLLHMPEGVRSPWEVSSCSSHH